MTFALSIVTLTILNPITWLILLDSVSSGIDSVAVLPLIF